MTSVSIIFIISNTSILAWGQYLAFKNLGSDHEVSKEIGLDSHLPIAICNRIVYTSIINFCSAVHVARVLTRVPLPSPHYSTSCRWNLDTSIAQIPSIQTRRQMQTAHPSSPPKMIFFTAVSNLIGST